MKSELDLDRLVALAEPYAQYASNPTIRELASAIPTLVARVREQQTELDQAALAVEHEYSRATEAEAKVRELEGQNLNLQQRHVGCHAERDELAQRATEAEALADLHRARALHAEARVGELQELVRKYPPQDRGLIGRIQTDHWQELQERAEAAEAALRQAEGELKEWREFFVPFRQQLRGALFPFWPNNPGVNDQEIVDAVHRCVTQLRHEREARARAEANEWKVANEWQAIASLNVDRFTAADALAEAAEGCLIAYNFTALRSALAAYAKTKEPK